MRANKVVPMTIQPARRISQVVVPLRASQSCSSLWLSLCWPASFFSRLSLMSFRVLSLRSCLCCRVSSSYRRSRSKNWQTEQHQNEKENTQTLKELTDRTASKWEGEYADAQRTNSQNSIKMRRRIRRRSKNWRTEQHQNEKENTQTLKELTDRTVSKWGGDHADAQRTNSQNSIKRTGRLV